MVLQKCQISPQYLNKSQITITILEVLNPVNFVVKESPSLDGSFEAKNFIEAEEAMQKYYESVEPCFSQLPLKNTIIVVFLKDKFYRAKVIGILTLSAGHLFKVYLVDYGLECSVERECIYEIEKDFLEHPFQAISFKLLGIEPVSLIINEKDLTMSYGPVSNWDPPAKKFVHDLLKEMCNAYIEIQTSDEKYIYGKLFICYENNIIKCVNDELISNNFAHFNENFLENVQVGSSVGNTNLESRTDRTPESLKLQESTSKQMSSPSSSILDQDFKMTFVSPGGKVVAESSLMECNTTEENLQSEFNIDGKIVAETSLKESSTPEENLHSELNPPDGKIVAESPLTECSTSEDNLQSELIAQKKFIKLQQLHRKKLQSPISTSNYVCNTEKNLSTAEHTIHGKIKNESPSNVSSVQIKQHISKSSSKDSEETFDSEKISPYKSSVPSAKSNLIENPCVSKDVQAASNNSPRKNEIEPHIVAQHKLLKLQQLHRKQLPSPICHSNGELTSIKNKSPLIESAVNLEESSAEICIEKSDNSVSEMLSKQNDRSQDLIDKLNELGVSCDSNNSSNSCFESNVSISARSGSNLKQGNITEDQLIAHRRFEKLQQLSRKKLKSPTKADSPCIKSSPTGTEIFDNSLKSLSSDSSEAFQPNILNNCVQVPSESSSKQENTSEDQLIACKRFEKLRQLSRKKLKSPIQVDSTSIKSSPTGTEIFDNSLKSLSSDSPETLQPNISNNCVKVPPESSSKEENTSENSNLDQIFGARVSQIQSCDSEKMQVINDEQNELSQKKTSRIVDKSESLTNKMPMNTSDKNYTSPTLNNSKNRRLLQDLSPSNDVGSSIINELLNASDSDDLLSKISKKRAEKEADDIDDIDVLESFIELSTKLQCSGRNPGDFTSVSFWEKQEVPILELGTNIATHIPAVEEVQFSKHLNGVLKEIKFLKPTCLQSAVWPLMNKHQSMIIIAPPCSGKTISYMLPLVSYLTSDVSLPKKNGPFIIILCSSWVKVQAVNDLFCLFLQGRNVKIVTLCTHGGNFTKMVLPYINDCAVLIATPFCLFQFLKKHCISLAQCKHFILEDGAALMSKSKKELKNIFLFLMDSIKSQNYPQIVVCAEQWDKNFQIIKDKLMLCPPLFFTSFLESAIYAKVPVFVHVSNSIEKKTDLLNVLNENHKVVLCTTNVDVAVDVHHFLRYADIQSFLVNEEMEHDIADGVVKDWKSVKARTSPHCLVITDSVLKKNFIKNVKNADCLIHYDIPQKSRYHFGKRFSCIAEQFQNMENTPKCICHIFIEESEYRFSSKLVEILENSGGTPSEKLIKLAQKKYESENASESFCPYMKAFGFCKKPCCKHRHSIDPESDKPQIWPCEGDIQALVTHIIDVSHFYVQLRKYLDPVSNKTVSLVSTYANIGFQLRDFYKHAPKELVETSPVVGKCYILAEENCLFYRIKILDFKQSSSKLHEWKILFLDEGWVKYYSELKLYKITNQIKLPEPLVVEVYACKILPPDSSYDWNPQTTELVKDLIQGKEIHGKIALCIKDVLFLNPIVLRLQLSCANEYVNLFKLDQKLLEYGHVKLNKNHLVSLKEACENKIPFPHLTKSGVKKEVEIQQPKLSINYAFLNCDICEDVYVTSVVSPHHLYVQRAKFVDCLDELIEKINEQVVKRKLKKAFTLYKGMHCIALFDDDDRYYRAVITDIMSFTEVQIFYVDFGDSGKVSRNNLYCLPEEFLLLPFQAIECELAGIAAAHGGWTDSASKTLETLTRDDVAAMKILQLKAYSKSKCYEGGNHYIIDLWYNGKNLSEQLLQAGFGVPADIPLISSPKKTYDNSSHLTNNEMFDLNDTYSTDEETHPDDKESTAAFYGVLAKLVAEENNLIPKPSADITEVSSDEEELLKTLNKPTLPSEVSDKIKTFFPNFNQVNKTSSEMGSNSLKPLITWWDKPEELSILINVKEAKLYQLDVTSEGFVFNTITAGKQYSTAETFFAEIISCDAKTYQNVQGINIVAKKKTPFKWPRLTKEMRKFLHIKYDLIHLDDSDTEEQSAASKRKSINVPYVSEEDSSSTDADEKYVKSWKDFAQNLNPCDLIS